MTMIERATLILVVAVATTLEAIAPSVLGAIGCSLIGLGAGAIVAGIR